MRRTRSSPRTKAPSHRTASRSRGPATTRVRKPRAAFGRDQAAPRSIRSLRGGPGLLEAPSQATRWPDVGKALARQPWDSLVPLLLKAGAKPDEVMPRLRRYCELLLQWNRRVSNLISRNDEAIIVERHIATSIEPAHWLKASAAERWLDLGSGGGLPAIPLVLAGVPGRWTLVESRRTKTLFLRRAIDELGISNAAVVMARLEDLTTHVEHVGAFDGFTSRATMTLGPTLSLAARFVCRGGLAFLWKGSRREEEMKQEGSWRSDWDFDGLLGIGDGLTAVARFKRH
jgi:16S rRNA (guanine527-N7)-methyltransferase